MLVFVPSLILNHAGGAADDLVWARSLVVLEVLSSKDVETVLAFYRFFFTIELKMLCLSFSFYLSFTILTWNFDFAAFFSVVFCHILSGNDIFAKITNN